MGEVNSSTPQDKVEQVMRGLLAASDFKNQFKTASGFKNQFKKPSDLLAAGGKLKTLEKKLFDLVSDSDNGLDALTTRLLGIELDAVRAAQRKGPYAEKTAVAHIREHGSVEYERPVQNPALELAVA